MRAQSKLTAEEDEVYTEYEIDVIRIFRGTAVHLDTRLQTKDYDSVEDFAAALANPPPTIVSVTR